MANDQYGASDHTSGYHPRACAASAVPLRLDHRRPQTDGHAQDRCARNRAAWPLLWRHRCHQQPAGDLQRRYPHGAARSGRTHALWRRGRHHLAVRCRRRICRDSSQIAVFAHGTFAATGFRAARNPAPDPRALCAFTVASAAYRTIRPGLRVQSGRKPSASTGIAGICHTAWSRRLARRPHANGLRPNTDTRQPVGRHSIPPR